MKIQAIHQVQDLLFYSKQIKLSSEVLIYIGWGAYQKGRNHTVILNLHRSHVVKRADVIINLKELFSLSTLSN